MIVRHIDEIRGTRQDVDTPTWTSLRFLLAKDGMGYSMHETIIKPGTETHMCYRNHLETVYCIEGEGEIETAKDKKVYAIRRGVMYALNEHDEHYLRAKTPLRLICVFNPPVTGDEVHDETGAYPAPEDVKEAS